MTGPARTVALIAVLATLVLSATPATASAGVGGTVCSLTGWVSGLAAKLCTVATHAGRVLNAGKKLAGGHVGGAIGALTGSASKTVARAAGVAAIAAGVIGGAQEALKLTVSAVGDSTDPDLGAVWFSASYWRMAAVAALLTVPFLFAAAIQAMLRSDVTLLLRSAFGYLPLGMLAVGVAAPLTGLLLAGSDEMSTIVSSASGHAGASFLDHVGALGGVVSALSGTVFVSFFIALFTIAAAITLWLELLIRQAAVYVIVLMLPLFFAAMVWPARRIWAARAVELLVALILSKFAIVAVLGLGGAALGHTLLPGIGSFLAGTTLVLLAAFSPWAMLRLLPLHELAGAAVGGLRPHTAQPPQAADSRTHGATDATESALSAAAGSDDADPDVASEDVAAGLPARLRAFTRRDRAAESAPESGGAAGPGGDWSERDGNDERGGDGGGGDVPESNGTRGPRVAVPNASGAAAANGAAAEQPAAPIVGPETDVFGPTERRGELPEVFRSMSLDGGVMQLDQPLLDDGGPPPPVHGRPLAPGDDDATAPPRPAPPRPEPPHPAPPRPAPPVRPEPGDEPA
ncbi:MAG TPA: hypothetical protein VNV17_02970 [Solirubrobacteraceae bacterium]|nr:hypothetical protein [Solirubrobacteraceae bacterium]